MPDDSGIVARWRFALAASRDQTITRADMGCLMSILDRMDQTGTAWPGLGQIAKDAGIDRATAVRSVNRLVASGYLDRQSGDRTKSNRYRLGRCGYAPRCDGAPRCADATGVGAAVRLEVGAPMRPEPASLNLPIEPAYSSIPSRFPEFWNAYPRKEAKAKALAIWTKQKLDAIADAIVTDLKARAADPQQWTEPKFIPHPTTYLNARRWEDEWPRAVDGPRNGESLVDRNARRAREIFGRLPREENAAEINERSMQRLGLRPARRLSAVERVEANIERNRREREGAAEDAFTIEGSAVRINTGFDDEPF